MLLSQGYLHAKTRFQAENRGLLSLFAAVQRTLSPLFSSNLHSLALPRKPTNFQQDQQYRSAPSVASRPSPIEIVKCLQKDRLDVTLVLSDLQCPVNSHHPPESLHHTVLEKW